MCMYTTKKIIDNFKDNYKNLDIPQRYKYENLLPCYKVFMVSEAQDFGLESYFHRHSWKPGENLPENQDFSPREWSEDILQFDRGFHAYLGKEDAVNAVDAWQKEEIRYQGFNDNIAVCVKTIGKMSDFLAAGVAYTTSGVFSVEQAFTDIAAHHPRPTEVLFSKLTIEQEEWERVEALSQKYKNFTDYYFKEWTCAFPGKMGLSWKRSWYGVGTKEEAETNASTHRNVIALPLKLLGHIKEMEKRTVVAEDKLAELGIRIDYENAEPVFVNLKGDK